MRNVPPGDTLLCPECRQGKPDNCTGEALAPDGSTMVACGTVRFDPPSEPTDLPRTPYAGTSGFSGTDTSESRARTEDSNGTTSERQRVTYRYVQSGRYNGITVRELRERAGLHHGQASSALSVLHKEGVIERLSETRGRCKVYVVREWVAGRPTEPHSSRPRVNLDEFEVHASATDDVDHDLVHRTCAMVLCTIEIDDTMAVLLSVIRDHHCD